MNKREARRYVFRVLAQTLLQDRDNGSGWLEELPTTGEPMSEADRQRVLDATHEVEDELRRRGGG